MMFDKLKERRRQRKLHRRREHARALAGIGPDGMPSLLAAAQARTLAEEAERPPTRWGLHLFVGVVLAVLGSVSLSVAVMGYGWGWWVLAATLYISGFGMAWGSWLHVRLSSSIFSAVLVAVVALAALVGGASTEIIAGKPVSSWSLTAKVSREVRRDDTMLRQLQDVDALLALKGPELRARARDVQAAFGRMKDLAAEETTGAGPTPALTDARRSIGAAADAAANGLELQASLAAQYDARAEAQLQLQRATLIQQALQAGQLVRAAAADAGIPLGVQE